VGGVCVCVCVCVVTGDWWRSIFDRTRKILRTIRFFFLIRIDVGTIRYFFLIDSYANLEHE